MEYDFQSFSNYFKPIACIVSVEKFPDGSYGNIRLKAINSTFFENAEKNFELLGEGAMHKAEFIPDQPYERYIPKDKNFEDLCYRSAILGEMHHTYIHPDRMPVWMYISSIPLRSDREDIGYCAYIQEVNMQPDYAVMARISPDVSANVLQICMKLRSSNDFMTSIKEVISDIRDMCDAEHCCILLSDFSSRKCSVLCEALSNDTKLASMEKYVNDDFFDVIDTWHGTIAGSTCAIIKDDKDWQYLSETNPVWYNSMRPAGAESIVLFPLKYREETLGYIWAINFDVSLTMKIKEMLELATYFLASEIANNQLFSRLEMMSSKDVLTGIFNRNAMNNRVDGLIAGSRYPETPICVLFADLNGLKQVNDSEGHFAGDLLLKDAALSLQRHFPEYEIYRAGGDEFMVLALESDRDKMMEKIIKFKQATSEPDGVCFAVGWSFSTIDRLTQAMREADENMYVDKEEFYKLYPERRR